MEIMIVWFWLVKLVFVGIVIGACYIAFWKKKFGSKFWNILAFALIMLSFIIPVKIGVNTTQMQNNQNYAIEQIQKYVPETIKDNSFENSVKSVKSIDEATLK